MEVLNSKAYLELRLMQRISSPSILSRNYHHKFRPNELDGFHQIFVCPALHLHREYSRVKRRQVDKTLPKFRDSVKFESILEIHYFFHFRDVNGLAGGLDEYKTSFKNNGYTNGRPNINTSCGMHFPF